MTRIEKPLKPGTRLVFRSDGDARTVGLDGSVYDLNGRLTCMAEVTDNSDLNAMYAFAQDYVAAPALQKSAMKDRPGAWLDSLTSAERKDVAMSRGLLAYFPDALALVARHSVIANEKHNPGEPLHWSREKSSDHNDCIIRHSTSIAVDPDSTDDGQPHVVCRAWRALAALQLWAEAQVAKREKV